MSVIRAMARDKTAQDFQKHIDSLGIRLGFDEMVLPGKGSPLAQPYRLKDGYVIGNRFAVQPMEGWDGTEDGRPSEYTIRRWQRFGQSGAKLIWGGEAVAVCHAGRANPNQLMITEETLEDLRRLRETLVEAHINRFGSADGLLVGVQLTHSGRFARPNSKTKMEPVIAYHHPYLDEKFHVPADYPVISDEELDQLVRLFVERAQMAQSIGFDFVDVKHCHGYLGHELLSAFSRPGRYGGSFENRTRFLRDIVAGIRKEAPGLRIGVRLSVFDSPPYQMNKETKIGEPVPLNYPGRFWFGVNPGNPFEIDLTEPVQFLNLLRELDIELVNLTAGSPYYVPHIQRPALFPPSDGYQPPEDPLVGVARQVNTVAALKRQFPDLAIVGTGYSYLQEWLPNVGQFHVRNGLVDFIGLGRMVLSYPCMPADVLAGNSLDRKHICRTFSDCTTAPRNGMISGCYPLDEYYKDSPLAELLQEKKEAMK